MRSWSGINDITRDGFEFGGVAATRYGDRRSTSVETGRSAVWSAHRLREPGVESSNLSVPTNEAVADRSRDDPGTTGTSGTIGYHPPRSRV